MYQKLVNISNSHSLSSPARKTNGFPPVMIFSNLIYMKWLGGIYIYGKAQDGNTAWISRLSCAHSYTLIDFQVQFCLMERHPGSPWSLHTENLDRTYYTVQYVKIGRICMILYSTKYRRIGKLACLSITNDDQMVNNYLIDLVMPDTGALRWQSSPLHYPGTMNS